MELRPYQQRAYDAAKPILAQYQIVYLALETRLGKTIISLSLAKDFNMPVLFVTKKKAIPSIEKDYAQSGFTFPIQITNYEQLKNVKYAKRLIIIDEAHGTGAYPKPSLRAKQLRLLTTDNPVILLSATPTPEGFTAVYHQLWAANAHLSFIYQYKNFYAWAKDYVNVVEKIVAAGVRVKDYSQAKEALIMDELSKITVSMTQAEAMFNFTDLDEAVITIPMPDWLKNVYKVIKKDSVIEVKGHKVVAESAVERMSKLHQLCGGTIIDENGDGVILSAFKIDAVQSLFREYGKIAVYYKFKAEFALLSNVFQGFVTSDWQEFQAMDRGIFLSQFLSGKEGINLSTAKAMVFYNIDYAFVSYEQSKNRIQKIDRAEKGKLFYLFSDIGMEKAIQKAVNGKENFTKKHFTKFEKEIK